MRFSFRPLAALAAAMTVAGCAGLPRERRYAPTTSGHTRGTTKHG